MTSPKLSLIKAQPFLKCYYFMNQGSITAICGAKRRRILVILSFLLTSMICLFALLLCILSILFYLKYLSYFKEMLDSICHWKLTSSFKKFIYLPYRINSLGDSFTPQVIALTALLSCLEVSHLTYYY
jgi:hypothetical protein